jgi:hypothetical protein
VESTHPAVMGPWNNRTTLEIIEYTALPAFVIQLGHGAVSVNVVQLRLVGPYTDIPPSNKSTLGIPHSNGSNAPNFRELHWPGWLVDSTF